MTVIWKVYCEEKDYRGLWQRWYRNQCAAIGYHPDHYGFPPRIRNALSRMKPGHYVIAYLGENRLGRLGQITELKVSDKEWDPLIPNRTIQDSGSDHAFEGGAFGRRILVRWDLTVGPQDPNMYVRLPESSGFPTRAALCEVREFTLRDLKRLLDDEARWFQLSNCFQFEKSLSDFIADNPGRLEYGLVPHPNLAVREQVFKDKRSDGRKQSDVLLMDRNNNHVVVECKQGDPTSDNIDQLVEYIRRLKRLLRLDVFPRGILVHGGTANILPKVNSRAKKHKIQIVRYHLDVNFQRSGGK